MRTHRIAVIAGDGVGPEVVAQGLRVLRAAAERFGFGLEAQEHPFGSAHWLKTQEILPDGAFQEIQQAMGTPKGRLEGAKYLLAFVEEMKASGFVAEALKRSGQSARVAPPAN